MKHTMTINNIEYNVIKLLGHGKGWYSYLDIDIEAERILKEYIDGQTNFVVQDDLIYYIDYECNNYMDEWNFENWGIKYWSKTQEFLDYLSSHK